ncbi:MAG: L,D-transpeptidase family protein [Candidatus Competibacteraceae bacterium]|nr:L,D-transpeptidase family protein [Candidatus Competibacteraceae bacterium]
MSKRIVFSILVSTLLGACALDSMLVAAQQVNGGSPSAATPPAGSISPSRPEPVPAVASLQPGSDSAAAQDELEPESAVKPDPGLSEEVVAAPPPLPPCPADDGGMQSRVAAQICQQVRAEPPPTRIAVQNRELRKLDALIPFYGQRNYQAAWLDRRGRPTAAAAELLGALDEAGQDGLRASDYGRDGLKKLETALQQGGATDARTLAEFDLLFTDAYLSYGSHLLSGRFEPRKLDPEWAIKPRSRDLARALSDALSGGDGKIAESLRDLAPKSKGYTQLREVLQRYRKVEQAGGWPTVGAMLGAGAQGPQVRNLRARLQASGDLTEADASKNPVYDKAVSDAVRRFQKRHGLGETGTVNGATLTALNVPLAQRIRQVELNLERWRWLPDEFGSRYILVNIPNFKMNVIEDGKPVMEAKVVVGREERQTPTFTANMAYLVMSPKWYVPRSIAVKDKLPQLKRNPQALARQNIRIYNSAGQQINPSSVNWKAVGKDNFNYQLRQDAGPRNALGGIKFMFPNPYNVYLHDTPTRGLFSQNQRTFSSGCIRLSNPVELAEYLLKHDPKWNRQTIKAAATSGKQRVVNLPQQVPVYLLYWTAWVDESGQANFRGDIYNRDKSMVRALYQDSAAPRSKGA